MQRYDVSRWNQRNTEIQAAMTRLQHFVGSNPRIAAIVNGHTAREATPALNGYTAEEARPAHIGLQGLSNPSIQSDYAQLKRDAANVREELNYMLRQEVRPDAERQA